MRLDVFHIHHARAQLLRERAADGAAETPDGECWEIAPDPLFAAVQGQPNAWGGVVRTKKERSEGGAE